MTWSTALHPTGPSDGVNFDPPTLPTAKQEGEWFSQLASLCDPYPNIRIDLLFFINLTGAEYDGREDQTSELTDFMNALRGHSSIYGAMFEPEYFTDTAAVETSFHNIVTNAGYVHICFSPTGFSLWPNNPWATWSEFPWAGSGPITTDAGSKYIYYSYGETGGGTQSGNGNSWTQDNVLAIVEKSYPKPDTVMCADLDNNNPAGGYHGGGSPLWNSPILREWIWDDPYYQANYVQSGVSGAPPISQPTTLTLKVTQV
jgi:hypothetical protein